jgi:predicted DNA-binding protein with PD1-like motif
MHWVQRKSSMFVRVDPGESLIASLEQVARETSLTIAVLVSGVGMLSHVEFGFFDVASDDYQKMKLEGLFDVSVLNGNVTRRDGEPVCHIHVVMNDPSANTFSGHVIQATSHITMELFLELSDLPLERVKLTDHPATRLVSTVDP